MKFISAIYIPKHNLWCMARESTQQKIFHPKKLDGGQSGSQNWMKTLKIWGNKYIHLSYIYKGTALLEGIQAVFWIFVFFGTKRWVLEFLDFVGGPFVRLFFNFVDFNHCLCESPVFEVSKMGCDISVGLHRFEILQFKVWRLDENVDYFFLLSFLFIALQPIFKLQYLRTVLTYRDVTHHF